MNWIVTDVYHHMLAVMFGETLSAGSRRSLYSYGWYIGWLGYVFPSGFMLI